MRVKREICDLFKIKVGFKDTGDFFDQVGISLEGLIFDQCSLFNIMILRASFKIKKG